MRVRERQCSNYGSRYVPCLQITEHPINKKDTHAWCKKIKVTIQSIWYCQKKKNFKGNLK